MFLNWLADYLEKREIAVKIENVLSYTYNMDHGVPQGSVLGPLIFLLFFNDSPRGIMVDQLTMLADDTS